MKTSNYIKPTKAFTYSTPVKTTKRSIKTEYNPEAGALSFKAWKDERFAQGAISDSDIQLQSKYLTYAKNAVNEA